MGEKEKKVLYSSVECFLYCLNCELLEVHSEVRNFRKKSLNFFDSSCRKGIMFFRLTMCDKFEIKAHKKGEEASRILVFPSLRSSPKHYSLITDALSLTIIILSLVQKKKPDLIFVKKPHFCTSNHISILRNLVKYKSLRQPPHAFRMKILFNFMLNL